MVPQQASQAQFLLVLVSSVAPKFLAVAVVGPINAGLVAAFLVVPLVVVALTGFYVRRSNQCFDAMARTLREEISQ